MSTYNKMNYQVAEEFLKNNPDFNLYLGEPIKRGFSKVFSINGDTDFENLESGYIINSKDDYITLIDAKLCGLEIYKVVNKYDCD